MLQARLCGSHTCWELTVCLVPGAENTAVNKRQHSCSQGCQSFAIPTGQCLHWAGYNQCRWRRPLVLAPPHCCHGQSLSQPAQLPLYVAPLRKGGVLCQSLQASSLHLRPRAQACCEFRPSSCVLLVRGSSVQACARGLGWKIKSPNGEAGPHPAQGAVGNEGPGLSASAAVT